MSEREPPRPPRKEVRATIVDSGWTSAPPPPTSDAAPSEPEVSRSIPKRGLPPLPEPTNSPLAGVLPDLPDAPFPPLSNPDIGSATDSDDNDGAGLNSFLSFTPVSDGTFFIDIGEVGNNNTGEYGLVLFA